MQVVVRSPVALAEQVEGRDDDRLALGQKLNEQIGELDLPQELGLLSENCFPQVGGRIQVLDPPRQIGALDEDDILEEEEGPLDAEPNIKRGVEKKVCATCRSKLLDPIERPFLPPNYQIGGGNGRRARRWSRSGMGALTLSAIIRLSGRRGVCALSLSLYRVRDGGFMDIKLPRDLLLRIPRGKEPLYGADGDLRLRATYYARLVGRLRYRGGRGAVSIK